VVRCRPIGMLKMTDEHGSDTKLLAVPTEKLTPMYKDIKKPEDLPRSLLATIEYFFDHYKDLEENKWVDIDGWFGSAEAKEEITKSVGRFKQYEQEKTEGA